MDLDTTRFLASRWVLGACGLVALAAPGLPLDPPRLVLLLVVMASLALPVPGRIRRVHLTRVLAAAFAGLAVVAAALAATAPRLGLEATYWSNPTADGAPERTLSSLRQPRLDLRGEEFAVHFFNDATRFNFGPDVRPARDQLPFSVRFSGFLNVVTAGVHRFELESVGPAHVAIDQRPVLDSPQAEGKRETSGSLELTAGLHPIRVEYARPTERLPSLRLAWQPEPGSDRLDVLDGPTLRTNPDARDATPWLAGSALVRAALVLLVALWVVAGVLDARKLADASLARAAVGAVPLVFAGWGMLSLAPLAGRSTILSGLDDWLVYESSARDILLNGPLMTGGQDHAAPYYGQPLYPYVLAVAHLFSGEGLFGPLVLQFAALGCVVALTGLLAARAFGSRLAGLAGLAAVWLLVSLEAEHVKVARQLFNENLYMPLVMLSLVAVVGMARPRAVRPRWWQALLVGVLFGATAVARSQFLLWVPFGLLVLGVAWGRRGTPAVAAIVVGLGLAIAPVTLRNLAVSNQLVLISSSGAASLLEFHRPPPGLIDQGNLARDPLFNALHLDDQTRTVLAFARQDPRGYASTLIPPLAHSLGLQGRNDPGIYWPLLVTVVLYAAAFGLRAARRLHVWPIHAFVLSHLLVLMLFEADTYGYRLVVPMYAPMAAVVGPAVLMVVSRALEPLRPAESRRLAPAALGALTVLALGLQARSLADGWADRETSFHGLGGLAAHAARTADEARADTIYVASVDGTPRHFGAGNLPGLRYPRFKWFDPSRSLPLAAEGSVAVYALGELADHSVPGDLVGCLGPPESGTERVLDGAAVRQRCGLSGQQQSWTFDDVARLDAVELPPEVAAGETIDARLAWQPLSRGQRDPLQISLHVDDPEPGEATLWGNGTLELYPPSEWEPSEAVLSRLPIVTDVSAVPQSYTVSLGMAPGRPNAAPLLTNFRGARVERVPVASVTLTPGDGSRELTLPADMQPPEGSNVAGGGLELVGMRPLPAETAPGGRFKVGILWRAQQDGPAATELETRLVAENGQVVQHATHALFGGRVVPSTLRKGAVVRDESTLVLGSKVPSGTLTLEVDLLDARGVVLDQSTGDNGPRLGTLRVTGRSHVFDTAASVEMTFGDSMDLLAQHVEPAEARAGSDVVVHLRWRAAAEISQPLKVFVHVLDASGEKVVAQRDAEPMNGDAPTTSWLVGEVIDDSYTVQLPKDVQPGDYPIEIGVYDGRSGQRLLLGNGDSRALLSTRLQVR